MHKKAARTCSYLNQDAHAQKKADAAYDRLTLAGKRLMDIIYSNAGLSNKDKAKFEAQINNLADKWEL